MASFTAFLEVGGGRYPLLGYELSIHQQTDSLGRPASPTLGGQIDCTLSAPGAEQPFLMQWMFSPTMQQDGKIVLLQEAPRATLKTISFFNAYCTGLQTQFTPGATGGGSLQLSLRISPQRIAVGAIVHDNNWPLESHGAGESFAQQAISSPNSNGQARQPNASPGEASPGGFMEGLHTALDVVGMIPGIGEVADLANAGLYASEGRYAEAAMSAAAMVPFAGAAVGAAKILRRGSKLLSNTRVLKALKNAKKLVPSKLANKLDDGFAGTKKCMSEGHPVDVATGMLFTQGVDVSLPGLIPFTWERTWYSASSYRGPLGFGWHHAYDWGLTLDEETRQAVVRMADGRQIAFEPPMTPGVPVQDVQSGLSLYRPLPDAPQPAPWIVQNQADGLYYTFAPPSTDGTYQPLNSIENATGQYIGFRYHANSRQLDQITDSASRVISAEYNEYGQLTALYGPHPDRPSEQMQLVGYAYDEWGNLSVVTDAEGHQTHFLYDAAHQLIQETNAAGLSFYFEYEDQTRANEAFRCVHTWGDGGIYDTHLEYVDGQTTVVRDSYGQSKRYTHQDGLVTGLVDALGHEQRWLYNPDQQLLAYTDGLGQTIQYRYDEVGNLLSTRYADGTRQDTDYDEAGRPVVFTDARGSRWQYAYDEQGLLVAQTDPLDNSTYYAYDEQGRLSTVTNALEQRTQLRYNEQHQLAHIVTPDEQIRSRGYDALGRLTSLTDPTGSVQQRQYDRVGQLIGVTEPDGAQQLVRYDGLGNVVEARQGDRVVEFRYSGQSRLVERRQANQRTAFRYDLEGRLTGLTNEAGRQYRFGLDATGLVAEEEGFDGLLRRYERDAAGRVVNVNRPAGRFTRYGYSPTGQLTQIQHSDGTQESYRYDEAGGLLGADNEQTSIRLERDELGRVRREWQGEHWIDYSYDALGQRTQLRSSLGADMTTAWDALGNVGQLTAGDWQAQFGYDSRGLEVQRKLSGGVQIGWQRDAVGRPTQQRITAGAGADRQRTYQWQTGDILNQIDDSLTGVSQYQHDVFGALISAQYGDGSDDLRLPDSVGNLYENEAKDDRAYGPGGQLLRSGQTTYHYDEEGNLIRKDTQNGEAWHYSWLGNGMLSQVVRPDGETVSFTYDALGRRLSKTYKGRITRWVWEGNKPLHEWQELVLDGQNTDAVITWLFEQNSFAPIGKLQGAARHSILTDHLGTPLAMIDQHGQYSWQAQITVYGRVRLSQGTRAECPFRFQGQYEDVETGLYYNRARYYDAAWGSYISRDPLSLVGGSKPYAYVRDTASWIDVFGLIEVYRLLRSDEDPNQGLSAKKPNRGMTTHGHVSSGSRNKGSQFISTSTDPEYLANKYHKPGQTMVRFDTDNIIADPTSGQKQVIDISSKEKAIQGGIGGVSANFADKSKEVLVVGHVPAHAIETVDANNFKSCP